jgi:hypothetical protein
MLLYDDNTLQKIIMLFFKSCNNFFKVLNISGKFFFKLTVIADLQFEGST